jgi:hypothetical protein
LTGWSPFEPGDADNSSLPVAALEYRFTSRAKTPLEAVFSFNCKNFMAMDGHPEAVRPIEGGFILWNGGGKDKPWDEGAFSATVTDPGVKVNYSWFRGGWWDALTLAWKDVESAACHDAPPVTEGEASPGATLFVPISLAPGASKTVVVRLAWYSGKTNFHFGKDPADLPAAARAERYRPWYAGRFSDINSVSFYWRDHYDELRRNSSRFRDCFYDSTLPPEVMEAVAANLTILKSPTVLRQTDGKLWAWEGCSDNERLLQRLLHPRLELRPGPLPSFPGWNAPCAKRNSGRRKTRPATRPSAAPCPSGRSRPISTRRPTASWAAS